MRQRNGIVLFGAVAILLAAAFTGAAAYNSFTADRDASLDVVSDDSGIIGLSPGGSEFVQTNADGALEIDVTSAGASGVNVDAELEVGDPAAPTSTDAFSITNSGGSSRTVELSYTLSGSDPASSSEQVNFTVYDSSGTQLTSVSEGDTQTLSMSDGETNHVVLTVNTTQVTDSADYSGTLTIDSS